MTEPKKYTRTETVEAWQWNGPGEMKDNHGVVRSHPVYGKSIWYIPKQNPRVILGKGRWIIKRGHRYEVISDAKFKAQGWEEMGE